MKKTLNLKSILDIIAGIIFGFAGIFVLINGIILFAKLGYGLAATLIVGGITNLVFGVFLLTAGILFVVNKFKEIKSKYDKYIIDHVGDTSRVLLGGLNVIFSVTILCELGGSGVVELVELIILSVISLIFSIATLVVSLLPLINKNVSKQLGFLLGIIASASSLIMVIFQLLIITTVLGIVGYVFFILGDILLTVISCLLYFNVLKEEEVKEEVEEIKIDDPSKFNDDATLNTQDEVKTEDNLKDQSDDNSENKN